MKYLQYVIIFIYPALIKIPHLRLQMRICEYVLFFVIFTLGKAQDGGILLYPVMDENDGRDVGLTVLCDDGASPEQYQAICK